jgi:DNA-binding NarL/FixJ family response regulator
MSVLSEQDLAIVRDLVTRARLAADGVDLNRLNEGQQGHGVRELRQGGWHTGSRTPDELAAREREVAELIVEGLTNQEIAEQLQIACGTAGQYVKSIIAKLGARNRTHAAVLLVRCVKLEEAS